MAARIAILIRCRSSVYDETIRLLRSAVQKAKLGRDEEMQASKRLDDQARTLERVAQGPSLDAFAAAEIANSPALGGRSVFGWEADLRATEKAREGRRQRE